MVRWGIMGTGAIASDMVQVLLQLPHCRVVAVGSRSQAGADRFGKRWNIPKRHPSYAALAEDDEVDIVYVATPSLRHPEDCKLALNSGKAVLCEKTMAPSAAAAREVFAVAEEKNALFVHAVWSRFFPAMRKLREMIASGAIGTVRSANVSFCQRDGAGSCSALLETGIYCAQFLQWVLTAQGGGDGPAEAPRVRGAARVDSEGGAVDEHVTALLEFPRKRFGRFECSLAHCSERDAVVYGTDGVIKVPYPFWCPTKFSVVRMSGPGSQQWSAPFECEFPLPSVEPLPVAAPAEGEAEGHVPGFTFVNSQGLLYEAEEMNRCFREGLKESPHFTTAQCLEILDIIDEIDAKSRED